MAKLPSIKELFSDPAHQEDANFFREVFSYLSAEQKAKIEEERRKRGEGKTLLQRMFDSEEEPK